VCSLGLWGAPPAAAAPRGGGPPCAPPCQGLRACLRATASVPRPPFLGTHSREVRVCGGLDETWVLCSCILAPGHQRAYHRGALSTLYYPYMPSLVPPRGRGQTALLQIRDWPLSFPLKADIFSAACISEYHAIHNSCDRTGCGWTGAEDRLRPTRVARKRIISFCAESISVSKPTNLAKPLLCLRSCLQSSNELRQEPRGALGAPWGRACAIPGCTLEGTFGRTRRTQGLLTQPNVHPVRLLFDFVRACRARN
jgi:hypothetical protein